MKKNNVKTKSPMSRLLGYLGPYRAAFVIAIILLAAGALAYAFAPYEMGIAIDQIGVIFAGKGTSDVESAFVLAVVLMAIFYIFKGVSIWISQNLISTSSQKAVYDLRRMVDHKISKLPLNYYDTTTYGDILSRVTNDLDTISNSLATSLFQIFNCLFTVICVVILMIYISVSYNCGILILYGLLCIPLLFVFSSIVAKQSQRAFNEQMKQTGELNGYVEEYYNGHNIVALFGREDTVSENFNETNVKLFKASEKGMYLAGTLFPFAESMGNLSYLLVACGGALISIASGLPIGMIQAFTQYETQLITPLGQIMQTVAMIQSTNAAALRIFEFLDEEEEVPETTEPKFPEKLEGKVEFDHVQFGYVKDNILIHDLNEIIVPGTKNAIVGPTGAGKTTLVNLIMRFYDVNSGAIRIDGVDIRDMKRSDLRMIFGMVLQDTWLYSGTIMDNIRYGRLEATDEEVIEAAKAARADGFIQMLPGGYNFELLEGASNIAQGQRQLLTIARAMLADAPILILDEATSSVDTRTEVLIQEAMNNIMKGRTSFVIAHRLSTIKDSDKILYMQAGDILEVGNHEELMAKDGLYAKLYNSQFASSAEE